MGRKVVNRVELRRVNDAAEQREGDEEAPATKAKATKKATTTRRKRSTSKEVRKKALWAVVNQSLKPVAKFEYSEKHLAQQKAEELSAGGKAEHFVQLLKEEIAE